MEEKEVKEQSEQSTSADNFKILEDKINDEMRKLFKLNQEDLQRMFSDFMKGVKLNDSDRDETKQMVKESEKEKNDNEVVKIERKEDYLF